MRIVTWLSAAALSAAGTLVLGLLEPNVALAEQRGWTVSSSESRLDFIYSEGGAPVSGAFERFDASGAFNVEQPAQARFTLDIDIDSVALSDVFRTSFVKTEEWFDVEAHPSARFELTRLARLEPNVYLAKGLLTIKGETRVVYAKTMLEIDPAMARAQGELRFNRRDFDVGAAPSALNLLVEVGDEVTVAFDLVAAPN